MTVEERQKLIDRYQRLWRKHTKTYPPDLSIEAFVRNNAGYFEGYGDRLKNYPVLLIPALDLKHFGVRCGKIPEAYSVFKSSNATTFLTACGIEDVVGCVSEEVVKDESTEFEGIPLGALAFKTTSSIGRAFALHIRNFGGSLRCEEHGDWCLFESE